MADIIGPVGPQGRRGPQGEKGDTIIAIITGVQGPQGISGVGEVVLYTTTEWADIDADPNGYRLPSGSFGKDTLTGEIKSGDGISTWALLESIGYSPIKDISYTDLKTLTLGSLLIPEQKYRITDFAIDYFIPPINEERFGPNEPLIVTARDESTLYDEAFSELYPTDIIRYTLTRTNHDGTPAFEDTISTAFKGWITYREDPIRNIISYHDWRNCKVRLFAANAEQTIWIPRDTEGTGIPREVTMVEAAVLLESMVIDIFVGSNVGNTWVPHVAFLAETQKILIGTSTDPCIFNGGVSDVEIGSCCSVVAYGSLGGVIAKNGTFVVFKGDANGFELSSSVVVFEGNIEHCLVMTGLTGTITGDHTNELIGYPPTSIVVDLSSYSFGIIPTTIYLTYAEYLADIGNQNSQGIYEVSSNESENGERGWYIFSNITNLFIWVSNISVAGLPDITQSPYLIGSTGESIFHLQNGAIFPSGLLGIPGYNGRDSLPYARFEINESKYKVGDTITVIVDSDPTMISSPNRQSSVENFGYNLGFGVRIYNQQAYVWTKVSGDNINGEWTLSSPDIFLDSNVDYSGWGNNIMVNNHGVLQRYTLSEYEYNIKIRKIELVIDDTVASSFPTILIDEIVMSILPRGYNTYILDTTTYFDFYLSPSIWQAGDEITIQTRLSTYVNIWHPDIGIICPNTINNHPTGAMVNPNIALRDSISSYSSYTIKLMDSLIFNVTNIIGLITIDAGV